MGEGGFRVVKQAAPRANLVLVLIIKLLLGHDQNDHDGDDDQAVQF
jgi:hypothetical protein